MTMEEKINIIMEQNSRILELLENRNTRTQQQKQKAKKQIEDALNKMPPQFVGIKSLVESMLPSDFEGGE